MRVARATAAWVASSQAAHLVEWSALAGRYTSAELAEPFGGARATVYRAVNRAPRRHVTITQPTRVIRTPDDPTSALRHRRITP
jgi:hypothetical protein